MDVRATVETSIISSKLPKLEWALQVHTEGDYLRENRMYQSFIQVKNNAQSAIARSNYYENSVCTLRYHLNDRGKVTDKNHYYSYTCGPEDLSKIDGKSYSGVEGSIYSCGVYTPNFMKSRTINSGDPRYGVSYTCVFSRDFQEIKL